METHLHWQYIFNGKCVLKHEILIGVEGKLAVLFLFNRPPTFGHTVLTEGLPHAAKKHVIQACPNCHFDPKGDQVAVVLC